jgi:tRNA(adenine34) deaminase
LFSGDDVFYMNEALIEAKIAFEEGEVPIGAVLVYEKKIIARAHNTIEKNRSVLSHAELLCLEQGSKTLQNWRLLGTTLYVTVEPCMMCSGAILHARVPRIVWGCPNTRFGGHNIGEGGLLEREAKELLQKFFQQRRKDEDVI